jgi:hypothetical protein
MFDLLLLPNEQNKARLQYLSSLSPIGTNDAIKITTTAVLKENKCPLLPPYIDLFSPSLPKLHGGEVNSQGEATTSKSDGVYSPLLLLLARRSSGGIVQEQRTG